MVMKKFKISKMLLIVCCSLLLGSCAKEIVDDNDVKKKVLETTANSESIKSIVESIVNETTTTKEETTTEKIVETTVEETTETVEKVEETINPVIYFDGEYKNVSSDKVRSVNAPTSESGNSIDLGSWGYGITPIRWVYVDPNIQIISNTTPNGSTKFGYKMQVSSGKSGCYMPIYTRCDTLGSDFDGRLYCFEDYKKSKPEDMLWTGSFNELKFGELNVIDILKLKYNIEEVTNNLVKANGTYVNVVYVSELEEILSTK